uniref:NR LBD domain-containing protein n=1 Tax=Caenorhabditis tropicalis TaxID=1561998 RepID=A0A1I7V3H2_9PELO
MEQRDIYASALYQYCLMKDSTSGPSRYVDLLSISQVANKTYNLIEGFAVLFQCKIKNQDKNDLIKFE